MNYFVINKTDIANRYTNVKLLVRQLLLLKINNEYQF